MNKTTNKQTKIWWVMDENDKVQDFFNYDEYCTWISKKLNTYKSHGYSIEKEKEGNATDFKFTKNDVEKTMRLVEIKG